MRVNNPSQFDLEEQYSKCKTIPGTCSHHSFISISKTELLMYRFFSDNDGNKLAIRSINAAGAATYFSSNACTTQ